MRLELRGVGVRVGEAQLLAGVDLDVAPGTWTAVLGRNGAGKSTLLRVVAGVRPYLGSVRLDGAEVAGLRPRERALLVALAPQSAVLPEGLTVADYVLLGRTPHRGPLAAPGARDRVQVAAALQRLDLAALAGRRVGTLSGGERQRAVLARALVQEPRLLVLDEPTGALDLGHAQEALELVDVLRREEGLTVLSALHDLTLAGQYADRLLLLDGGRAVAAGTPEQVLTEQVVRRSLGARTRVEVLDGGQVRVSPVRW